MHVWIRRIVILLTIGASFSGLTVLRGSLGHVGGFTFTAVLILAGFTAYFVWGLIIGLAFVEGHIWEGQLVAFFALQVPYVQAPGFAYHALTGVQILAGDLNQSYTVEASFGPDMLLTYGGHDPWGWAINLVPLAIIIVLVRSNNRWRGP